MTKLRRSSFVVDSSQFRRRFVAKTSLGRRQDVAKTSHIRRRFVVMLRRSDVEMLHPYEIAGRQIDDETAMS